MYEQQFGLKKRPFLAKSTGNNVFVGPQTANAMAGLKKGLLSQDAVVTVSGPPGAGKTTLVARALDALSGTHLTVHIGRMHLKGTDVLEFLLEELGTTELPRGTIRQFTALREKLGQLEAAGKRVVIAVEDAIRTGSETLAELEALTAAEAGESGGAAIVLMGDGGLLEFLKDPQLTRLHQRIRQRNAIDPLSAAELRGYLMHCFRLAGNDFELVFDGCTADLVHDLCGGIPRVANNLVESAMHSAATAGMAKIPTSFVAKFAKEAFGLKATEFDATPTPAMSQPVAARTDNLEHVAPGSEKPGDPFIFVADDLTDESEIDTDEIPRLIEDEFPDLPTLAPLDATPRLEAEIPELTPEPKPSHEPVFEMDVQPVPEPVVETKPKMAGTSMNEPPATDIPEWERDPTIAELRPDLDALEKAMEFARSASANEPEAEIPAEPLIPVVEQATDEIPEITLDNAIQSSGRNKLIDEPGQISPNATEALAESTENSGIPQVNIAPRKEKRADAELERIAAELAKTKTVEQTDNDLAETLFGEEINLHADQVVTTHQSSCESANDDGLSFFDTEAAQMARAAGASAIEVSLETRKSGLDIGASQRLKTVRALNADLHPSLQKPENAAPNTAAKVSPTSFSIPESIEDQINTSMTQTLKALNVAPPISERTTWDSAPDDEGQEQTKSGFFSRFKRS